MHIIHVVRIIAFTTDRVFPIVALPYATFMFAKQRSKSGITPDHS